MVGCRRVTAGRHRHVEVRRAKHDDGRHPDGEFRRRGHPARVLRPISGRDVRGDRVARLRPRPHRTGGANVGQRASQRTAQNVGADIRDRPRGVRTRRVAHRFSNGQLRRSLALLRAGHVRGRGAVALRAGNGGARTQEVVSGESGETKRGRVQQFGEGLRLRRAMIPEL